MHGLGESGSSAHGDARENVSFCVSNSNAIRVWMRPPDLLVGRLGLGGARGGLLLERADAVPAAFGRRRGRGNGW